MRRRPSRVLFVLVLLAGFLYFQDAAEFWALRGFVTLTQPAPQAAANPESRRVADVVLRHYYDRLEAMAFYRRLEGCPDRECLETVLYDLDPHANLYPAGGIGGEGPACVLPPGDRLRKGRVVYLRLRTFELDGGCFDQVWNGLKPATPADDIVVDLRGNGGGFYEDALALAAFFLPVGTAVAAPYERYPKDYLRGLLDLPLRVTESGLENRLGRAYPFDDPRRRKALFRRVFVLVDGDSASASEIFANLLELYLPAKTVVAGDGLTVGVGNTIMNTYELGGLTLELPTAVLPGLGVFAEPEVKLAQAAKSLGLGSLPRLNP